TEACGQSPMDRRLWTISCGPSAVDHQLWPVDCGPSVVDRRLWTVVRRPSTALFQIKKIAHSRHFFHSKALSVFHHNFMSHFLCPGFHKIHKSRPGNKAFRFFAVGIKKLGFKCPNTV